MTKYFASKTTTTTTTSSLPVVFGHGMSQEQLGLVLKQGRKEQSCHSCSQQQERRRRQKFVEAYNEIVVENYGMIRVVQRFLILGPLAGLALIVRGMEMHTQHQSQHQPQQPCTTLFLGPLVVLVSTLTSLAAVLFLRLQLVEQLQHLCQQQQQQQQQQQGSSNNPDDKFHDWNVTLESNGKGKHTLVFGMATATMATKGEPLQLLQAFIGVPLGTRDADYDDSQSDARIAMV